MTKKAQHNSSETDLEFFKKNRSILIAISILIVVAFGIYGYYKMNQWLRYDAIERQENPISDYQILDIAEKTVTGYRGRQKTTTEADQDPEYFMKVKYNEKEYKLSISESEYKDFSNHPEHIRLYYDAENDDLFLSGTGGSSLFVSIVATALVLLGLVVYFITLLIKKLKKR